MSYRKVVTRDTETSDDEEVLRIEDTELYKKLDNATDKERLAQMEKYTEMLREEGNEQDTEEEEPPTSHNVGDRYEGEKYDNSSILKHVSKTTKGRTTYLKHVRHMQRGLSKKRKP